MNLLLSLRLRYLNWQADLIKSEREQYQSAGCVGRRYLFNSHVAELELRMRAAALGAK
jgi:hypothetical protein